MNGKLQYGVLLRACFSLITLTVMLIASSPLSQPGRVDMVTAAATDHGSLVFQPEPPPEFLTRLEEIADWIVMNSDYDGYTRLPSVAMLPPQTLNYIVYNQTSAGYQGQESILAIYLPNLVLLSTAFQLTLHEDTLVHELVHHFQFESGKAFRCPLEEEREAYDIQIKWMEENGLDTRPSPLFIARLTCHNPHNY